MKLLWIQTNLWTFVSELRKVNANMLIVSLFKKRGMFGRYFLSVEHRVHLLFAVNLKQFSLFPQNLSHKTSKIFLLNLNHFLDFYRYVTSRKRPTFASSSIPSTSWALQWIVRDWLCAWKIAFTSITFEICACFTRLRISLRTRRGFVHSLSTVIWLIRFQTKSEICRSLMQVRWKNV